VKSGKRGRTAGQGRGRRLAAVPAPYLVGKKVCLAPPEPEHATVLARWINDPRVWVTYGMDLPASVHGERRWIAAQAGRGDELNLMVFERSTGRPIGLAGLRNLDGFNRTARLGLLIGEPDRRGVGLGSAAARLLLDHGFGYLGLRRVSLAVLEGNRAALSLYRRLGFVQEGCERRAQLRGGRWRDRLHFGMFRSEYAGGS
jgi:RimJ/RimL family protein N-acetyltransferase